MFERFDEGARRALFFARFVATEAGAMAIAPSHLAAGVLRDTTAGAWTAIGGVEAIDRVRASLTATAPSSVRSAVEIPFTSETKIALHRAAEIATRLGHAAITPMHLLAGVMEDAGSDAFRILTGAGLDARTVAAAGATPSTPHDGLNQFGRLLDERAIERLCNELFIATDRKDWDAARAVFADGAVFVDMTSLTGGTPVMIAADQLIAGFREGLHRDKTSHHLVANYRVTFTGDVAEVLANGYACNRVAALAPNDLWETWGTYKFIARRVGDGWRLAGFEYRSKLTRGNDAVRTHKM